MYIYIYIYIYIYFLPVLRRMATYRGDGGTYTDGFTARITENITISI